MVFFYYYAETLPKVRMVGRAKYREPWEHFSRKIDEYILYIIREGEMFLRENNVEYHLTAGDTLLLESNQLHEGYRAASCDYYYVHFKHLKMSKCERSEIEVLNDLRERRRLSLISYNLDEKENTDDLTYIPKQYHFAGQNYRQEMHIMIEIYNLREELYKRRTSALFHSFLLDLAHESFKDRIKVVGELGLHRSELVVNEMIQYLNKNYVKKHTSTDIEMIFEMNFDYLNRVFRKMTGTTIFSYINVLRINNAKQLIETTNMPFSKIAYLVGIEDQFYFSKVFKKIVGCTATAYYQEYHKCDEE